MKIVVELTDAVEVFVDRDGTLNAIGHQGFDVVFGNNVNVHFEDEFQAEHLAKAILVRLGKIQDKAPVEPMPCILN